MALFMPGTAVLKVSASSPSKENSADFLLKSKVCLILVCFMLSCISMPKIHAQKRINQASDHARLRVDKTLQAKLAALLHQFHGTAGVYVENLKSGRYAGINQDSIFPTASIIKVPILAGVFSQIKNGKLSYNQEMTYDSSRTRGGSGLMQFFKNGSKTSLDIIISLMISYSDNVAALWCQQLAGGGTQINQLLEDYGFNSTRVNSRTPGREEAYKTFGWGQTTPREMATLLKLIRQQKVVDPASSDCMYRQMSHIFYDGYALSQIPPYIQTASKQGMVNDSRSELVMVNAPHGDYVFYIATKNNRDQRWEKDAEPWVLARSVSSLLWHYFEPRDKWRPAKEALELVP